MIQHRVVFVCLGNICRSPLAEGVFRDCVERRGLSASIVVDSAGTSAWHVGEAPDPGSVRVARQHGIDLSTQRARQFVAADFERFDWLIAMDRSNRRNMLRILPGGDIESVRGRLWLMRNFEEEPDGSGDDLDVPDPWGGGIDGFKNVYEIVARSCNNLLEYIQKSS